MAQQLSKFSLLLILSQLNVCQSQTTLKMANENNNPLLCDPEKGICEIPQNAITEVTQTAFAKEKAVKIIYFTDPICSSCWGIEPQLRKLKLEYGHLFDIEYRMGGLLPDWSYNSGGISKPSDVADHWDEVSHFYDMPIDGDIWLENPLNSSYPPSIAFKAAQIQDQNKAIRFLRRIREMVFLEKKNICEWDHLAQAATECDLNVSTLKKDYETSAKLLFEQDLALARKMGVRGFPSLYFYDDEHNQYVLYGFNPYQNFVSTLAKALPEPKKQSYDISWEKLFSIYPTLTAREFSLLTNKNSIEANEILENLTQTGKLQKWQTKNGAMWKIN